MVKRKSVCLNCNNKFIYEDSDRKGLYCSHQCWYASKNQKKFKVNCEICGKEQLVSSTRFKEYKTCSMECKGKMLSELCKKGYLKEYRFKKGQKAWNKGIPRTEKDKKYISKRKIELMTKEIRDKIRKSRKGKKILAITGEKHYNWQGGKSFETYGLEFNDELREKIRERDDKTCQECKYTEKQLGYNLGVHHIDYDKKNNNPNNLISLCRNCHGKTNYNRQDWINYYKKKVET